MVLRLGLKKITTTVSQNWRAWGEESNRELLKYETHVNHSTAEFSAEVV
jgi:hypothetical protein